MTNPNNLTVGSTFATLTTNSFDTWQAYVPSGSGLTLGSLSHPQPAQPPQPSSPGWQEKTADFYFEDQTVREYFNSHRTARKSSNIANLHAHGAASGVTSIWDEQQELKLVDKTWRHFYDEPWPGYQTWTYDELDLDKLEPLSVRKFALQPFKIEYETYQEIKLRLLNTVISIKGHPFLVKSIKQEPGGFKLAVWGGGSILQVKYSDLQDLRSIPPMYIAANHTGWLCRIPGRVYQQGMNRNNTQIRSINARSALCNFDPSSFITGFQKRQKRTWTKEYANLMSGGELSSLRLSDEVAVSTAGSNVIACYKGRELGNIRDNSVLLMDEDDVLQGWIERAARDVGLELRV